MIWCSVFAGNRPNSWEIACQCLLGWFHSRVHRHKGMPLGRLNWTVLGRRWLWTLPEIKRRCWKCQSWLYSRGFPGGSVVKNLPANAGDIRDVSLMATHSSILAYRIPWTEEPGGLLSMGSQRVRHNLVIEPRWDSGKESCRCRRPKRLEFNPWVRKIPWSRKWQPTLVFLPRECHGQRSLAGYSPWGRQVGHDWAIWAVNIRQCFADPIGGNHLPRAQPQESPPHMMYLRWKNISWWHQSGVTSAPQRGSLPGALKTPTGRSYLFI